MKESKRCPKCGLTKQASEFNKSTWQSDGLQSYCRDCQRIRAKERSNLVVKKDPNNRILNSISSTGDSPLSKFTPRELMAELKRRGYDGELTYTSRITLSSI